MFTASRIDSDSHEINPLSGKRVEPDARALRPAHPVCSECQRRPAVTRVRGRYVVLEGHDLCRQCWRAFLDSHSATRLARRARTR